MVKNDNFFFLINSARLQFQAHAIGKMEKLKSSIPQSVSHYSLDYFRKSTMFRDKALFIYSLHPNGPKNVPLERRTWQESKIRLNPRRNCFLFVSYQNSVHLLYIVNLKWRSESDHQIWKEERHVRAEGGRKVVLLKTGSNIGSDCRQSASSTPRATVIFFTDMRDNG